MAAVSSVNKNTIVVVNSVGPINMEAWINNVNGTRCFLLFKMSWLSVSSFSHGRRESKSLLQYFAISTMLCALGFNGSSRPRSRSVVPYILIDIIHLLLGNGLTDVLYGAYNPR